MKKIHFSLFLFVIIFHLYPQSDIKFINYKWGSSIDSIIMNEGIPAGRYEDDKFPIILHGVNYIKNTVTEYLTNISYEFYYNKLHMVNYNIFGIISAEKWIETYFQLRDTLKNIYGDYNLSFGAPDETDEQMMERILLNYSLTLDGNEYLFSRTIYHRIMWSCSDTLIELELYNNVKGFQIGILFSSPDYYINMNELYDKK